MHRTHEPDNSDDREAPQPVALHGLAVAVIAIGAYLVSMPRSITLEDAGLFQMACHTGGIAHPPGYPLYTLLCEGFVSLPFLGTTVIPLNFLSALFAAGACGILVGIVRELTGSRSTGVIAGLACAFSVVFWSQAIIAEVYSLAVLTVAGCWWCLLRFRATGDRRFFYAAALVFGLGLANHWPLILLAAPALALSTSGPALLAALKSPRVWLTGIVLLAVGVSPYALLLARTHPEIAIYGPVRDLTELTWYIKRSAYEDGAAYSGIGDRLRYAGWLVGQAMDAFGWLLAPVVAIGAWQSFRVLPRMSAIAIVVLYLGATFLLNAVLRFPWEFLWQAVFRPYPIVSDLALAIWFSLGATLIASRLRNVVRSAHVVIPVALLLVAGTHGFRANYRADDNWVEVLALNILATLPQDSVLFVSGDFEAGVIGYLHHVRGIRPDIELREWNNLIFANRLSDDYQDGPKARAARASFLAAETRPVFAMKSPLAPAIDLGLYKQYAPGTPGGVAHNPAMVAMTGYLLDLYTEGQIRDPHEQVQAYYLLVHVSRHLEQLERLGSLDEREAEQKRRLGLHFVGRLVTLETAILNGEIDARLPELTDLVRDDASALPPFIPVDSRAVYLEYRGRILARNDATRDVALESLYRSLSILPAPTNRALCAMQLHFPAAYDEMKAKYPGGPCTAGP